jgi:hypothetical protein
MPERSFGGEKAKSAIEEAALAAAAELEIG